MGEGKKGKECCIDTWLKYANEAEQFGFAGNIRRLLETRRMSFFFGRMFLRTGQAAKFTREEQDKRQKLGNFPEASVSLHWSGKSS